LSTDADTVAVMLEEGVREAVLEGEGVTEAVTVAAIVLLAVSEAEMDSVTVHEIDIDAVTLGITLVETEVEGLRVEEMVTLADSLGLKDDVGENVGDTVGVAVGELVRVTEGVTEEDDVEEEVELGLLVCDGVAVALGETQMLSLVSVAAVPITWLRLLQSVTGVHEGASSTVE
jgi:hypothetical protein